MGVQDAKDLVIATLKRVSRGMTVGEYGDFLDELDEEILLLKDALGGDEDEEDF